MTIPRWAGLVGQWAARQKALPTVPPVGRATSEPRMDVIDVFRHIRTLAGRVGRATVDDGLDPFTVGRIEFMVLLAALHEFAHDQLRAFVGLDGAVQDLNTRLLFLGSKVREVRATVLAVRTKFGQEGVDRFAADMTGLVPREFWQGIVASPKK